MLRVAAHNPTDMCPPTAVSRCMRIADAVRMGVVNAVRRDPLDRAAFERQRPAANQKIFDELWHFVAAMSDEPVEPHTYAQAAGDPVKDHRRD